MEPGSDEAWCNQRPGIVILIEECGGRPVKAGESFSTAFIVDYFDTIDEMYAVSDRYKGYTVLTVDESCWRLEKDQTRCRTTMLPLYIK